MLKCHPVSQEGKGRNSQFGVEPWASPHHHSKQSVCSGGASPPASSLQIPEKREASDRERPFWDTASRDWPSQPSERQKLTLSRTVTTSTNIFSAPQSCVSVSQANNIVCCLDTIHVMSCSYTAPRSNKVFMLALQYWWVHTNTVKHIKVHARMKSHNPC